MHVLAFGYVAEHPRVRGSVFGFDQPREGVFVALRKLAVDVRVQEVVDTPLAASCEAGPGHVDELAHVGRRWLVVRRIPGLGLHEFIVYEFLEVRWVVVVVGVLTEVDDTFSCPWREFQLL